MSRLVFLVVATLAACVARPEPPGIDASPAQIRAYCRANTSVARAQDLDVPGALPGQAPPRTASPRAGVSPSASAYADCLRSYGVTP